MPVVVKDFPIWTIVPMDADSSPDSREFLNPTWALMSSGVAPRIEFPKKGT